MTAAVRPGIVVIGAGTSGSECVIRLRKLGYSGSIHLIGAEPHLPYHRPPLSKAYLAGATDMSGLTIRLGATYASAGVV